LCPPAEESPYYEDGHLLEGDKRAAAESMSRALFGG
jgi:hypothetical protein